MEKIFACVYCGFEYDESWSPSDDFCSQVCAENWTYRQTAKATKYDAELDAEASRVRGDTEEYQEVNAAAVGFMGYLMAAARRRE